MECATTHAKKARCGYDRNRRADHGFSDGEVPVRRALHLEKDDELTMNDQRTLATVKRAGVVIAQTMIREEVEGR